MDYQACDLHQRVAYEQIKKGKPLPCAINFHCKKCIKNNTFYECVRCKKMYKTNVCQVCNYNFKNLDEVIMIFRPFNREVYQLTNGKVPMYKSVHT